MTERHLSAFLTTVVVLSYPPDHPQFFLSLPFSHLLFMIFPHFSLVSIGG
jgi:hypothetical protein